MCSADHGVPDASLAPEVICLGWELKLLKVAWRPRITGCGPAFDEKFLHLIRSSRPIATQRLRSNPTGDSSTRYMYGNELFA